MALQVKGREAALGFAWIYGILSTDSTLAGYAGGGVWRGMAQPDTTPPFVVMSHMSGTDTVTFGAVRAYGEHVYQVKAVAPGNIASQAADAAGRVDQLLDGAIAVNIPGSNGLVMSCYRQHALEMDELVTGQVWTNWIAEYRVLIRPQ